MICDAMPNLLSMWEKAGARESSLASVFRTGDPKVLNDMTQRFVETNIAFADV